LQAPYRNDRAPKWVRKAGAADVMIGKMPRVSPLRALRSSRGRLLAILVGLALLPGAVCSTGNPGTVFDPNAPGGGGDGGGDGGTGSQPAPPGAPAPPPAGALLAPGRPTVEALAPAAGAAGVDVLAPVVLWFSESVQPNTVNRSNLVLRVSGIASLETGWSATFLAGDRCVVLLPETALAPNTTYEVVAGDGILDYDGNRLLTPADGVLGRFTTANQVGGLAPRVLGSFPPRSSRNQPNDTPVVLVFSEPMDPTGLSAAVSLTRVATGNAAAYDVSVPPEERHAGNRVFTFPHLDDDLDLGLQVRLFVGTSVTDAEFFPQPLAQAWAATWGTLSFARPRLVQPVDADPLDPFPPAVDAASFSDFQVDVQVPPSVLAGDRVTVIGRQSSGDEEAREVRLAGGGTPRFHLDFSDPETGALRLSAGSPLRLAAFVERDGLRTTVQEPRDSAGATTTVPVDVTPPVLLSFGPPAGTFGSQFLFDVPELRPYGTANEPIGRVALAFPPGGTAVVRDLADPPADGSFTAPAVDPGVVGAGPFAFEVVLTDAVGNEAAAPIPGSGTMRGWVGAVPLAPGGTFRVVAYDRDTLAPLPGADVWIEDFGGGNEDRGLTGSDGAVEFPGRSGPQTVTVVAAEHAAVSAVGFAAAELSLPLTPDPVLAAAASPIVSGPSTGILRVGGSQLLRDDGLDELDLFQDLDLSSLFGDTLLVRLDRPGWFAGFHDVEAFPAAGSYFRFQALDPVRLTPPSTATAAASPRLDLVESTNAAAGTTDYQYPIALANGAGFDLPVADGSTAVLAAVPGLTGPAVVGAGSFSGANGAAELELQIHAAAVVEGAPSNEVLIQVQAVDADGDEVVGRSTAAVDPSPGLVVVTTPDVPEVLGAWVGVGHPFTRPFTSTLAASEGVYRMVVRDDAAPQGTWELWFPASAGLGGSLTLPSLRDTPTSAPGDPPLADDPGTTWTAFVEAYTAPAGFTELGFSFQGLVRDAVGIARSAEGPALAF